jgi:hypothetical protein
MSPVTRREREELRERQLKKIPELEAWRARILRDRPELLAPSPPRRKTSAEPEPLLFELASDLSSSEWRARAEVDELARLEQLREARRRAAERTARPARREVDHVADL